MSQTLWRVPRTRLVLSFFAALLLALPATVFILRLEPGPKHDALLLQAAHLAVPAASLFTITGLRIALRSPVAKTGAWAFRVIHGRPKSPHFTGVQTWVAACTCFTTLAMILSLFLLLPPYLRESFLLPCQAVIAVTLSILLTDVLFMRETAIPFTEQRVSSVNDLAFSVSTFFILFPVLGFALVAAEPWMQQSQLHFAGVLGSAVFADLLFRSARARYRQAANIGSDMEEEALLPGEIGLRSD